MYNNEISGFNAHDATKFGIISDLISGGYILLYLMACKQKVLKMK
jgi:hypothetical protein